MKMLYAIDDFAQERSSWKAIIQLNLIRHVLTILKVLEEDSTARLPPSTPSPILPDADVPGPLYNASVQPVVRVSSLSTITSGSGNPSSSQTAFHHTLRLRLVPLTQIESNLTKQLAQSSLPPDTSKEPMVHSYTAWMKHFGYKSSSPSASSSQAASPVSSTGPVGLHFEDEAGRVINVCKEDIAALWGDKVVRRLLQERKVRLELEGGFFLDDLDRVCALDYEPNDCECGPFSLPVSRPLAGGAFNLPQSTTR
jgi:guanine nucleotide-binding protein alpha-1 subunit